MTRNHVLRNKLDDGKMDMPTSSLTLTTQKWASQSLEDTALRQLREQCPRTRSISGHPMGLTIAR
jgi:hypothetical protein